MPGFRVAGDGAWQGDFATLADAAGVTLMPHSPYFGPGFLATLHLLAARGGPGGMVERYHMDLEASLYGELVMPVDGGFVVPNGPGLVAGRGAVPAGFQPAHEMIFGFPGMPGRATETETERLS